MVVKINITVLETKSVAGGQNLPDQPAWLVLTLSSVDTLLIQESPWLVIFFNGIL